MSPLTPHEAAAVAAQVEYALKTGSEFPVEVATVVEGDRRTVLVLDAV